MTAHSVFFYRVQFLNTEEVLTIGDIEWNVCFMCPSSFIDYQKKKKKKFFVWVRLVQGKASIFYVSGVFLFRKRGTAELRQHSDMEVHQQTSWTWHCPDALWLPIPCSGNGYLMDCRDSGQRERWLWFVFCPRADQQFSRAGSLSGCYRSVSLLWNPEPTSKVCQSRLQLAPSAIAQGAHRAYLSSRVCPS